MSLATASGRAPIEAGWSTTTSTVPCLAWSFANSSRSLEGDLLAPDLVALGTQPSDGGVQVARVFHSTTACGSSQPSAMTVGSHKDRSKWPAYCSSVNCGSFFWS